MDSHLTGAIGHGILASARGLVAASLAALYAGGTSERVVSAGHVSQKEGLTSCVAIREVDPSLETIDNASTSRSALRWCVSLTVMAGRWVLFHFATP